MQISDLIKKLQQIQACEGDLRVLVSGYEGGYDDPQSSEVIDVYDSGVSDWGGRYYTEPFWEPGESPHEAERVVVIPR